MSRLPPFPTHLATADLEWRDDTPVARACGDVYFSRDGGPAEAAHVFLDGNRLRERYAAGGFRHLTIGETGFGTGLNLLVAMQAFLALAPADAVLHFVSVEKFPLAPDDLARAHAHWPDLAALSAELRAVYPPAVTGFHRRALAGGRVQLTLLLGEASALLPRLDAAVDAWFLDGFAPAKNPDLWTPALFAQLARLSAPGATFATFTAAGEVRRGLQAAGFAVEKIAGFGRKRDMLRGTRTGHADIAGTTPAAGPRTAAVIGGGLAGCAVARALAERGLAVTLFERQAQVATETSGNLAGAVYPKFSVHETPQNRWYRDSYLHALARLPALLGAPDNRRWGRGGLLQLPDREGTDLGAIAATGRWDAGILRPVDAGETAALTGVALGRGGLWFPGAAWVHPPALCRALVAHPGIALRVNTPVDTLEPDPHGGHRVNGEAFGLVVVATALEATRLLPQAGLPLRRVRGQVTHVSATDASRALRAVICHDGYVTPARTDDSGTSSHCVGATFGPRDTDPSVRATDDAENLEKLAAACPALHATLGAATVTGGRTGFRAQTPDYLPVIGPVADAGDPALADVPGLYVLSALGAKGIAFSLLGAELIAAQALGEPLPVDSEVAAAVDPRRFAQRARRKAQPLQRAAPRAGGAQSSAES